MGYSNALLFLNSKGMWVTNSIITEDELFTRYTQNGKKFFLFHFHNEFPKKNFGTPIEYLEAASYYISVVKWTLMQQRI